MNGERIVVERAAKRYGPIEVFHELDLTVRDGEVVREHGWGNGDQEKEAAHEGNTLGKARASTVNFSDGPRIRAERAWETRPHQLRTAPLHHADTQRMGARSGQDPHHAGVGHDHLGNLAGPGDQH